MTTTSIHTYTASEQGLCANSYLLETLDGVVLVDANLLVSDARAIAAQIAALGKPLLAVFVTHAHPDHFNGLPYVASDDVPVYASTSVADAIAQIAEPKREQWQPLFGDEWPDRYRVPDRPVDDGTVVDVAGLRVAVHDLGIGESHADSYLLVEGPGLGTSDAVAFIGDLAFHGTHSYMSDGHTSAWLESLDRLSTAPELRDVPLYPGHGSPGGLELFAAQRRYVEMYRETVRRLADGAPALDDAQKRELSMQVARFLPDAPLAWLIELGADAVAAELASA